MNTIPITIYRICFALKITGDEYINRLYESGAAYIDKYEANAMQHAKPKQLPAVKRHFKTFRFSTVFWFWWRMETEAIDRAFLRTKSNSVIDYAQIHENGLKIPPQSVLVQIMDEPRPSKKQIHILIK